MHAAAFSAVGVDAGYVAFDVRQFGAAWSAVRRLGVRGGNVTVPWKAAAAGAAERLLEPARLARSANTFWRTAGGELAATQTDGEGFLRALREDFNLAPAGLSVAVLGLGGAGRAVLHALAAAGAAALHLWNRSPKAVDTVARELKQAGYLGEIDLLDAGGAGTHRTMSVDLVVNATPLGLRPDDRSPADPRDFPGARFAMELVYGTAPSAFLRAFERAGSRVADGRSMLLHQGALSFERWLDIPAPVDAMREALAGELSAGRIRR